MKIDTVNAMVGDLTEVDCPKCKNKGYVAADREGYLTIVECDCMRIRKCVRKMEASGLKHIITDSTFDAFQTEQPWQETVKAGAMAFAEKPEGWFLLCGQSGAGKTHLCTAICRELLHKGMAVRYMPWREEIGKLKAMSLEHEGRSSLLEELKNAQVLYIDDLFKSGTEYEGAMPTGADGSLAFEILNYRDHNRLVTILSTEKLPEELMDIDAAIGGRILCRSSSNCYVIEKNREKNFRLRHLPV